MSCYRLDAEQESGSEVVIVSRPPPRTDGEGHERPYSGYSIYGRVRGTEYGGFDSQAAWMVTGVELIDIKDVERLGNDYGALVFIRGCFEVATVHLSELCLGASTPGYRSGWPGPLWPTRVTVPPRQNLGLAVSHLNADEVTLRMHWHRAHDIQKQWERAASHCSRTT